MYIYEDGDNKSFMDSKQITYLNNQKSIPAQLGPEAQSGPISIGKAQSGPIRIDLRRHHVI